MGGAPFRDVAGPVHRKPREVSSLPPVPFLGMGCRVEAHRRTAWSPCFRHHEPFLMSSTDASLTWAPRWYLWEGGFFALGRSQGVVPPHAHHAIQIAISIDGEGSVCDENGEWRVCRGMIIRPDVKHSFDGRGAMGAMLFVDPESHEGAWLCTSVTRDVTVIPERRLETCVGELRTFIEQPLEGMEIGELIRHCVSALCVGVPPVRRLDDRVERVLQAIREADDLRISLDDAARKVFLSPSRFGHLFTEHVGVPFRRYMLWRKLSRAMLAIGRGRTISAAAHAGGFADAAHLTRTFYQMFGIPPSIMMRGEFFELPSPFGTQGRN